MRVVHEWTIEGGDVLEKLDRGFKESDDLTFPRKTRSWYQTRVESNDGQVLVFETCKSSMKRVCPQNVG
jgi:hypothetical protein